jgi:hypothetical protein
MLWCHGTVQDHFYRLRKSLARSIVMTQAPLQRCQTFSLNRQGAQSDVQDMVRRRCCGGRQ